MSGQSYVLHVDLDQFVVAVELLRRPELKGKPVVVGGEGDPTKRGVVSSASYEARAYGIRSGVALRTAARRHPDAVFLPVDRSAYEVASKEVMSALESMDVTVEVAGWDEAFMAVTTPDPEAVARTVQRTVLERARLSCSVGIGDNKLQAKLASEFAKPGGVFRLTAANWHEVMDHRAPDSLWGIGRKRARALAEVGIRTVRDLAGADPELLGELFGPSTGPWLVHVARGEHQGTVRSEPRRRRSVGRERTFQRDLVDPDEIASALRELAAELAADLERNNAATSHVVLKIRFAPFETHTRSARLERTSNASDDIERAAVAALAVIDASERAVRLLGLRATLDTTEHR